MGAKAPPPPPPSPHAAHPLGDLSGCVRIPEVDLIAQTARVDWATLDPEMQRCVWEAWEKMTPAEREAARIRARIEW